MIHTTTGGGGAGTRHLFRYEQIGTVTDADLRPHERL